MKTIAKSVSPSQQSVTYAETLEVDGIKLRISIKSDSHDFQSHARIEAFSAVELKWNNIAFVHYSQMRTRPGLIHEPRGKGVHQDHFLADRDELIRQAALTLDLPVPNAVTK